MRSLKTPDLNPKIRSKMSIILSRVSLDDFQLKIRSLLRNSEFRDIITELPKGQFVFPEMNLTLTTEPFIQEGTPYLQKPKPTETKQQSKKISYAGALLKMLFQPWTNPSLSNQPQTANNEDSDELE